MNRISLLALSCFCTVFFVFGAGAAHAATLFAPEYSSDNVYVFDQAADGTLSPGAGSPFPVASGGTTAFVPSPDGAFGFATYLFSGGVRPFSISAANAISPLSSKLGSSQASDASISPNGKNLYVATRDPGSGIRAWSIAADGTLSAVAGSPFSAGTGFTDVVQTPDGALAFASTGSQIAAYRVNADGTLTFLQNNPLAGVIRLIIAPDGRSLIALAEGSPDSIAGFAISATGALEPKGTWLSEDVSVDAPAITPDGQHLYACDSNSDKLYVINLNAGQTPVQNGAGIAFEDCTMPIVSQDGRFLYIVHTSSSPLAMFRATIGSDGRPGDFIQSVNFNPGEPVRMSFKPGQGAIARVKATVLDKPLSMRFDGSTSTAGAAPASSYSWSFGALPFSAPSADPQLTHEFSAAGVFELKLRAADSVGCSGFLYDGHYAVCNGTAAGTTTLRVDTPPWVKSLKVSPSKVSSRTQVKFKLTEAATLTFAVQRAVPGRSVNGSCKKQTGANKKRKKCTRWVGVGKKFTAKGKAAKTNSFKFTGSVKGKKLASGSYRFSATAKDSAGGVGPAVTAKFKIPKKKKRR